MIPLFVILLAICGAVIITFVVCLFFLPVIRIFMIIIDDNGNNDHRDIIDDVANDDQNI